MKKHVPRLYHCIRMISRYVLIINLLQCFTLNLLLAKESEAQSLYDVPLRSIQMESTIEDLFRQVESQTSYTFSYNVNKVDLAKQVSIRSANLSLGALLEIISSQSQLQFRRVDQVIMVRGQQKTIAAAFGTIRGTIADLETNDVLPGASIRIANTSLGAVSDLHGAFTLRAPEGEVTLEISYIGYDPVTQTVRVVADEIVTITITMQSNSQQLDNIVITGSLQGQQRALNQQKTADNIRNVISADQIGRFPDPNVAEALQRVPAVNIERDQGEGRYVLVRGLSPQFTNISVNGEQIPSPEAGVRYVALDAVPADQLSSIEVSKAITPDMDGDAIGGSVNLITRTALSEEPTIKATALVGYNKIVARPNLQGSLELGKRFFDNRLGIMLNGSYYESDRGSDNWERDDSEMEIRDYELVRTRTGFSSTIDYKINDRSELYFRTLYNRFTDREQRRRYILIPNADNSPFENTEIERATKDRLEKQIVSSFNLGARHVLSGFSVDYEVAYAEAYQDTPFDIEITSVGEFDDLVIDFDSRPKFPTFTVDGVGHRNKSNPYLDNSRYEFDEFVNGSSYALDVNKTAKVNITIPYQLNSSEGLVKLGGKVRQKDKRYDITENVFGWSGGDVTFPGFEAGDYTLEKFSGGTVDRDFLDGRYLLRANADPDKVIRHFNANRNAYELDVEEKLATEAVESYEASEDVYAAYAMSKLQIKKLMILGGFRYEKTKVQYASQEVYYDFEGELESIEPVSGSTDYGFLLPQLHVKYSPKENLNIRLAVTRSYARPNFQDIVPAQEIDLNAREGTVGNTKLKPVAAINADLLVERYFGNVGILSGGLFYKHLTNFIFNNRFETSQYQGRDFGTDIQLTQARNGESAGLFGVEIAYQQNLSFLPGIWKGLSIYGNYTLTHSQANIQSRTDNGTEKIRLPGQARHVGNLSIGYDAGRFNFRVSSNFNGEYITEVGEDASEDLYVKDRLQIDATATVTLTQKLRFFTEFLNITNQPFEVFRGNENYYVQREFYSWWARIGMKFDF